MRVTFLSSFFLFISLLLAVFFLLSGSLSYYNSQFEDLGVNEQVKESSILVEDLVLFLQKGEVLSDEWNDKEKAHMQDVKKLFDFAHILFFLSILLFSIMLYKSQDKSCFLSKSVVGAFLFFIAFSIVLMNFSWWFTLFHTLSFSNMLWIMDPSVDVMIMLFPEKFFFGFVRDLLWICFGFLGISYVLLFD